MILKTRKLWKTGAARPQISGKGKQLFRGGAPMGIVSAAGSSLSYTAATRAHTHTYVCTYIIHVHIHTHYTAAGSWVSYTQRPKPVSLNPKQWLQGVRGGTPEKLSPQTQITTP